MHQDSSFQFENVARLPAPLHNCILGTSSQLYFGHLLFDNEYIQGVSKNLHALNSFFWIHLLDVKGVGTCLFSSTLTFLIVLEFHS